ncbi:hypothetical protein D3C85_959870 [compost metagenome]
MIARMIRPADQSDGNSPCPTGILILNALNWIDAAMKLGVSAFAIVSSRPDAPLEEDPTSVTSFHQKWAGSAEISAPGS